MNMIFILSLMFILSNYFRGVAAAANPLAIEQYCQPLMCVTDSNTQPTVPQRLGVSKL